MSENRRRHIPEVVVPGKRLGRHLAHDPRSLRYAFKAPITPRSVRHSTDSDPILDQGDVGSCTGNAEVGALLCSHAPLYAALSPQQRAMLNEPLAVKLYTRATQTDPFPGSYPNQDTGSDGNDVAKAGVQYGYLSGYTHATSLNDALAALTLGPFIFGQNWYEGMDSPNQNNGLVKVTGQVRGGHETCYDEINVEQQILGFRNSWTAQYGKNGRAYISFADFERLMHEDGDVTVLAPLSVAPPTPTPPADADQTLVAALAPWAAKRHAAGNREAAQAFLTWRADKGL